MAAPIFRGKQVGWGDIKIPIFGAQLVGLLGIKYDVEAEEEVLYGAGREPQGIGAGNNKYSGSLKMYRWQANEIMSAAGGQPLHTIDVFVITVMCMTDSENYKDVITCKFTKTMRDLKQGDKMDEVETPLTVVGIKWGQSS